MKCAACGLILDDYEAMRVDGRQDGKPFVFFVHRPSVDGRCFSRAVYGQYDRISLVLDELFDMTPLTGPFHCPVCVGGDYYGKLLFAGDEVPACPNPHYIEGGSVYAGTKPDAQKYEVYLVGAGETMGHPNDVLTGHRVAGLVPS